MKRLFILVGFVCLIVMLLPACAPAPEAEPEPALEPKDDVQAEQTLQVMDKWLDDVWMQGKLELVPELVGPTYVRHRPGRGTWSVTPEEYSKVIAAMHERYPELEFEAHDYSVNGNKYWHRYSWTGKNTETGEGFRRSGIQIYRIENGKLVETWIARNPTDTTWPEFFAGDKTPETE